MADKHKVQRCEGTDRKSWTQTRTDLRKRSKIRDIGVRISLQTLNISQVAKRLAGILVEENNRRRKDSKVAGLIHVLDELTAVESDHRKKSKGILKFQDGYELFCSAYGKDEIIPDRYTFRDTLLSEELGLPIVIFTTRNNGISFIMLNSDNWNIAGLFDAIIFDDDYEQSCRFDLDAQSLKKIMDSMDTEYDKSVVRAILACSSSRSELYDLGLKLDTAIKNLEHVLAVSDEVDNALVAGKDMTVLSLRAKIAKKDREISELKSSIAKLRDTC